jgi:hypothetical protein
LIDFSNTISTTESENEALEIFLEFIRTKYHIEEQIIGKIVNIRHQKLIERENNLRTLMEINAEIPKEHFKIQLSYDDIEYYYKAHCKILKLRNGYNEFVNYSSLKLRSLLLFSSPPMSGDSLKRNDWLVESSLKHSDLPSTSMFLEACELPLS